MWLANMGDECSFLLYRIKLIIDVEHKVRITKHRSVFTVVPGPEMLNELLVSVFGTQMETSLDHELGGIVA